MLKVCKPDYAVQLLEVVKHMYLNEKTIFIVGTNNEQLSYTISNYYGASFDGYGYLNKFYNLIIELDDILPKDYLNSIHNIYESSKWIDGSIIAVCEYFNFQMRDINRIDGFMNELGELWRDKVPDWRFGQFILNFISWYYTKYHTDIFYIEDTEMLLAIEEFVDNFTNN